MSTLICNDPGFHDGMLIIMDNAGCSDTSSIYIQVSPRAEFSFDHIPRPCLEDTFNISATIVQRPIHHYDIAPTLLPDLDTTMFTIEVEGFPTDAVISTGADIATICVDMEHSYMGDLVVQLTCPNGDTLVMHQGGGGGTYLGLPVDGDNSTPVPGGCWYYCWNSGSILSNWEESAEYGVTPNVTYYGDDASLQAGTYRSLNSFDDLIGCPMNGTWTLSIGDRDGGDNGYSCGWNIQFAGQPFQGPDSSNVRILEPHIGTNCDSLSWQGLGIISFDNACAAIQVASNSHGTQLFSLTATDDHGCVFTGNTTVNVLHFDPHISGPTVPPFGIPVDYSADAISGSPSYIWTSNTALVYFFNQPNAQAAWTTSENSWIAVKVFEGDCAGTDTLFIEGLTGIPVEHSEAIVAYPNPSNGTLNVPSAIAPSGQLSIRIVDHIGRLIDSRNVTELTRPFQLDTSTIPTGSYRLEMRGPGDTRSLHFMVIH